MKRSCTSQAPCQAMIFTLVWRATLAREEAVGHHNHRVGAEALDHLAPHWTEVQQMSTSAFTSADVLT